MLRQAFYIVLTISLLAGACRKTVIHSPVPEISFKAFYLKDSIDPLGNQGVVGSLVFSFIDGDGDLGLNPKDSVNPGDTSGFNLFFTLYYMDMGTLVKANEDEVKTPLNYRIPYLEPGKTDIELSGEIQVDFFYLIFPYDTISYDFYIVDRAGNQSNIESTPLIVLNIP
ncbi:MAG: hypothetical protein GXO83_00080 [Chlorobi bacterium]|nr:hypothetical protein [Chlorobiota bacterium]